MFRTGCSMGRSIAVVSLPALLCAMMLFKPATAEAKGFVLFTYGDDISKVADIPPAQLEGVKQATGAANPLIGYKYNQFGIFFLNIWTWSGEYVLYENDTYWDLGAEGAAQILGITPDQLKKPLGYRIPPGLILIIVLLIGGVVWKFVLPTFGIGGRSGGSSGASLMDKAKAKAAAAAAAAGVGGAAAASKSNNEDDADDDEEEEEDDDDDDDDEEEDDEEKDKK